MSSAGQLYFAYGSNLWLQQMATRCPNSRFVGRGSLPDHSWQINHRGFANLVPDPGFNVHGLVYEVFPEDEAALDRFEGTRSGAYWKTYQSIILYESDVYRTTREMVDIVDIVGRRGQKIDQSRLLPTMPHDVLVYLSEPTTQKCSARPEYVDRMNRGIRDAIALGVPEEYYFKHVRSWIPALQRTRSRRASHPAERISNSYNRQYYDKDYYDSTPTAGRNRAHARKEERRDSSWFGLFSWPRNPVEFVIRRQR